ncbi:MAG: prenyltransferase [Jatrophihabitans sp.]|uniref:prenyltransferase n=1 Tax=Jatrophihabitans sp. TaxID=1932789 RepID=UPI003912CAF5
MTQPLDRSAGEVPVVTVPDNPTLHERFNGWLYAVVTTNPPRGHVDGLTKALVLTRAAVLPMTLVAGLLAGLLAVRQPGFSTGYFLLALLGIVLAHVANNVMNDLFDSDVGQDTASYPRAQYAPHPILSGLTTRRQLAAIALAINLADLAIMIVLAAARGPWVLAFGIGGFLLSAAYTAPPLRLKKRGLGELDVFITWGPLMVGGTYFSATGHLPWEVWAAGLPYALLCTAVLMGKHTDKIPFDAPLRIRTVPVLLGRVRALAVTRGLIAGYYVLLVAAVAAQCLPWPALLGLVSIPAARQVWGPLTKAAPETKPRGFPVWPLWYAAWAFLHTRNAGGLLVAGVALAAIFDVTAF